MALAIRIWAIGGVLFVLGRAVVGLSPLVAEAAALPLTALMGAFAVVWVVFMAYAEAYKGFHLKFNPCVVARAHWLAANPRPLLVLLGPPFAMGLLHGSRARLIKSWGITLGVVALVMLVGGLSQPWRGLVDLGVVIGLALGGASMVLQAVAAERHGTSADPQLP